MENTCIYRNALNNQNPKALELGVSGENDCANRTTKEKQETIKLKDTSGYVRFFIRLLRSVMFTATLNLVTRVRLTLFLES